MIFAITHMVEQEIGLLRNYTMNFLSCCIFFTFVGLGLSYLHFYRGVTSLQPFVVHPSRSRNRRALHSFEGIYALISGTFGSGLQCRYKGIVKYINIYVYTYIYIYVCVCIYAYILDLFFGVVYCLAFLSE